MITPLCTLGVLALLAPAIGRAAEPARPRSPIACKLSAQAFAGRTGTIRSLLSESTGKEALADGYAFRFPADADRGVRLLDFITEERECCPFLAFELAFEPDGGPIWLRLRGPEGARSLIEEMTR